MSNKNKKDIELIVSFCSCGSGKKYGQCCYSNSPINIKRDAAISFSMPEGGAIKGVIDAGGYLCTVGEDAIYKITLADVIDPDRTVIVPFLVVAIGRAYATCASFMAGVMPPMPMLGRSLL